MAKQNDWQYCRDTTMQHPLSLKHSNCIVDLSEVCITEGAKSSPFTFEKCLNLDKVEGIIARQSGRDARKTMDISFGIKLLKQKRFVLCEYRLNYKNVNNLSKNELDQKISFSKDLLGNEIIIHNCYLFLFQTNFKSQAYSVLRRLYSNKNIIQVLDIKDLKDLYFN